MHRDENKELRNRVSGAMHSISNIKKKIELDCNAKDISPIYIVFDIFSGALAGFLVSLVYKQIFGYNALIIGVCIIFGLCSGIYLALMKLFKN